MIKVSWNLELDIAEISLHQDMRLFFCGDRQRIFNQRRFSLGAIGFTPRFSRSRQAYLFIWEFWNIIYDIRANDLQTCSPILFWKKASNGFHRAKNFALSKFNQTIFGAPDTSRNLSIYLPMCVRFLWIIGWHTSNISSGIAEFQTDNCFLPPRTCSHFENSINKTDIYRRPPPLLFWG